MPRLIPAPRRVSAAGTKLKFINEYVGRVASGDGAVSIAHMCSPSGWVEPGQVPDFDEYTIVLTGMLRVQSREGTIDVRAGQAIHARAGEWVQYSTPGLEGAEYIAVCVPAFSPETAHRDPSGEEAARRPDAGKEAYPPGRCCDEAEAMARGKG
jgi:mannose-6-phosphate isomerase-like protein (cupin superfamily)